MTTQRRRKSLTARLRAIARRSDDTDATPPPRSRQSRIQVVRDPRHRVWEPDTPTRSWFEAQGITPVTPLDMGQTPERWWPKVQRLRR